MEIWEDLDVSMSSQVTISDSVQSGQLYGFKYRAYNRQGWGEYSNVAYILAANAPAQITPIYATLEGSSVRLNWVEPDNGSLEITSYAVEILHSDGVTFSEHLETCDGADSTIVANAWCEIPMLTLTSSPFYLQ